MRIVAGYITTETLEISIRVWLSYYAVCKPVIICYGKIG
jgi:hypothetical protein